MSRLELETVSELGLRPESSPPLVPLQNSKNRKALGACPVLPTKSAGLPKPSPVITGLKEGDIAKTLLKESGFTRLERSSPGTFSRVDKAEEAPGNWGKPTS